MRILVFGAAGNVGTRVVKEALARGHDITAVVRNPSRIAELPPDVNARVGDAANPKDVAHLTAGQDVVITATRPAPGSEPELVKTIRSVLNGLRDSKARLLVVGGAGSLAVPGTDQKLVIDDPKLVPPAWRGIAQACTDQFEICRAESVIDWTYISPPALLEPGERTGIYRVGTDELLVDREGISKISMEDLAVALLDEAERPQHHRSRFTLGY